MEAGVAYAAGVLGGAIVTRMGRNRLRMVERSFGREIERDPARRGGRPITLDPQLSGVEKMSALIGSGSELSGKSLAMCQQRK